MHTDLHNPREHDDVRIPGRILRDHSCLCDPGIHIAHYIPGHDRLVRGPLFRWI